MSPGATGWLRGTVVEIPSGDQVVIAGGSGAAAPQKRLTLSSLIAPRLGKRDGSSRDEPFAWDSREFLRKKLIGQAVVFKVDYVVEAIGNREFGTVFLTHDGQQENVSVSAVAAGWAKVRDGGAKSSPYLDELKKAEESAQAGNLGVWNKDPEAVAASVRTPGQEFDAQEMLATRGKGKPLAALVEAVLNGSTLRVSLLPDRVPATIAVCGVQCPSMGKKVAAAPAVVAAPATAENGAAAAAAAPPPADQPQPEPGAREAKYFTESRILNREVRLLLEGVDKYGNLFASVHYPEGERISNLAEDLMGAGLSKAVDWSLNMMTNGAMRLREMERTAKQAQKGIWRGYVPQNTGQTKLSNTYTGRVVEVVSGDCVVVKDTTAGVERRINLSSIRAPRPGVRDRAPDPHGNEAKEFLRKRLIGKEVAVKMEYTRKVPALPGAGGGGGDAAAAPEREMSFGNVELVGGADEQSRNASEMVVARGYATIIRHRSDEERSGVYEKLVELEELARSAKRGVHSAKTQEPVRMNDLTAQGAATRAKAFLTDFQRRGKMQGVVEYVLSGHRLKVYLPKDNLALAVAPSGVKTPARAQAAGPRGAAVVGEPYADEALSFTRDTFMQREVEIEVDSVDKGGTFLGTVTLVAAKPVNLGLSLLRAGLAKTQPFFTPERVKGGAELAAAEAAARDARLKVWEGWTPEEPAAEEGEGEDADGAATNGSGNGHASNGSAAEALTVTVTDVAAADEFFLQDVSEPRVAWLQEQLAELALGEGAAATGLVVGSQCLAKYSLDKQWYRAYVERVLPGEPRYEVYFIDYGNTERIPSEGARAMPADLAAVAAQAKVAQLAHVKLPPPDSEWGPEALGLLGQLVGGGKRLRAVVVGRERPLTKERHPRRAAGKLSVVLTEEGAERSVNAEMLLAGMARLPKLRKVRNPSEQKAIAALQQYEDEARRAHAGMWVYGDPGDSDDEAEAAREAARPGGPKRSGPAR